MENFLWVFYFIILLAATSCALQADGAASEEGSAAQDSTEMVTNAAMDEVTIAGQGSENGASGSTIYVTLPPNDQSAEAGSVSPTATQVPSMSTTEAAPADAPQQPSSSPQVSPTAPPATAKPPSSPPKASANDITDDKPMAASKNSHEKPRGMENGAFSTTSSLPILMGVIALTLVVHS